MRRNFDLESYGEIISEIKRLGYKIVFFEDLDAQDSHLILRHDVDISLESALKMATYEASKEFYSTYFILLRSDMYNIYSPNATKIIKEIIALGHRIGLHFDHSIYKKKDFDSLEEYCQNECSAIQSWFNIYINTISFHKPSKYLLSLDKNIAGRINAYKSDYFKKILYSSDSRGDWYYGHPLDYLKGKSNMAIQLLTHPIWWHSHSKLNPQKVLEQFALKNIKLFLDNLTDSTGVFKDKRFLDHLKNFE